MVIDIPCLIDGKWTPSELKLDLNDCTGKSAVRIHGATDAHIRSAKRSMLQVREELASTPLSLLIKIIKRTAKEYLSDSEDCELLAKLSGSPITYVNESAKTIRHWMEHIELYLEQAFGGVNFERLPVQLAAVEIGYRKYLPTAPAIVILPSNEDNAPTYVLTQLFLSKNPVLVKPSSKNGSAFATERFLQALHGAILDEAPKQSYLRKSIQLINLLEETGVDRVAKTASLGVQGCTFIIFGSNAAVNEIAAAAAAINPRAVLKLGTGFSASVILDDANIGNALNEVCESIIEDRGNKCTTTHALYAQEKVYPQIKSELQKLTALKTDGVLDPKSRTGTLDTATRNSVDKRINESYSHPAQKQQFRVYELDENEPVEELPGQLVFLKKVTSVDHFCKMFTADKARSGIIRNLVTSVFTENEKSVDRIATMTAPHVIRWNIGSNAMNFFLEHQGMFLIKEVMQPAIIEHFHAKKAQKAIEVRA